MIIVQKFSDESVKFGVEGEGRREDVGGGL